MAVGAFLGQAAGRGFNHYVSQRWLSSRFLGLQALFKYKATPSDFNGRCWANEASLR